MQQIADWLEKLGLGQYAERFSENDIDFAILEELMDQDVEKIGVSSLGHRRKLLRAIANLKDLEKGTPAPRWGNCVASRVALSGLRRAPPSPDDVAPGLTGAGPVAGMPLGRVVPCLTNRQSTQRSLPI